MEKDLRQDEELQEIEGPAGAPRPHECSKESGTLEGHEPAGQDEDYLAGDTMCAWCDDGGSLVLCDGPCMRAFHMGTTTPSS